MERPVKRIGVWVPAGGPSANWGRSGYAQRTTAWSRRQAATPPAVRRSITVASYFEQRINANVVASMLQLTRVASAPRGDRVAFDTLPTTTRKATNLEPIHPDPGRPVAAASRDRRVILPHSIVAV